ncbi:MAG: ribonuclease HII [Bacteroidales bacterium]
MLKKYLNNDLIEAGCDEAGRGCLAGPVVAAAVILPKDFHHPLLNDSKQVSEKNREILRPIIEKEAIAFAVTAEPVEVIAELNILWASIKGMHDSLDKLSILPEYVLVDGNRFRPWRDIPYQTVVGGDGKYASIAAASILAKTYRDEYMRKIAIEYPEYLWDKNKGYPTKSHRAAIAKFGITKYHRVTFNLL